MSRTVEAVLVHRDVLEAAAIYRMARDGVGIGHAATMIKTLSLGLLYPELKQALKIDDYTQMLLMELQPSFKVDKHHRVYCALCGWTAQKNDFSCKYHVEKEHSDFMELFPEFRGKVAKLFLPNMTLRDVKLGAVSTSSLPPREPIILKPMCPVALPSYG